LKEVSVQSFNLENKVVAITGAAGILGRDHVKTLLANKARVFFSDANFENLNRLENELQTAGFKNFHSAILDITKKEAVQDWFLTISKEAGRLDVLVNNAQGKPPGFYETFEEYSLEALRSVLDVNLCGVILCCQEAGKIFLTQSAGNIVNVASIYGVVAPDQRVYDGVKNPYSDKPFSSPVSYAVSKAGVIQLTKYLASYYRNKNIRVNCLTPGGVYDDHDPLFVKQYSYRTLLGRMAEKNEYEGALIFLCSEASSYMTGGNLVIDGGWSAV